MLSFLVVVSAYLYVINGECNYLALSYSSNGEFNMAGSVAPGYCNVYSGSTYTSSSKYICNGSEQLIGRTYMNSTSCDDSICDEVIYIGTHNSPIPRCIDTIYTKDHPYYNTNFQFNCGGDDCALHYRSTFWNRDDNICKIAGQTCQIEVGNRDNCTTSNEYSIIIDSCLSISNHSSMSYACSDNSITMRYWKYNSECNGEYQQQTVKEKTCGPKGGLYWEVLSCATTTSTISETTTMTPTTTTIISPTMKPINDGDVENNPNISSYLVIHYFCYAILIINLYHIY